METALLLICLAIALLLVVSALFSGSETALTAASRARMLQLQRKGSRRAAVVNRLMADKERLIGGILLGNNLVNILASSLATSAMIGLFGPSGVAYATAIMTALVLIFAEVMPKTYAIHRPDRMALAVAPVINPAVQVLAPVVRVVQAIVAATLRLFGVRLEHGGTIISAKEELRGTLELHTREGGMVKSDRDMLDSVLDLPSVDVSEIMVHRRDMVMIDADQTEEQIVQEMLRSSFTRVPLYRGDVENIIGVLHARDLLRALAEGSDADTIDMDILMREPWFVPETTTLLEQLNAFRARREHFALVVDEYGALMGLVTLEDILEEIVGEISDEHDVVRTGRVRRNASGSYQVDGGVTVRDLNRQLDWNLPEDDAATVAGLLIHDAKRIPKVGESFHFHGFRFEVMRRQRHRINSLRITPPGTSEEPA